MKIYTFEIKVMVDDDPCNNLVTLYDKKTNTKILIMRREDVGYFLDGFIKIVDEKLGKE